MKKIMIIFFVVNILLFFIVNFWGFSNSFVDQLMSDKVAITIEKPAQDTTREYVDRIQIFFAEEGVDILYSAFNFAEDKIVFKVYSTSNTADFLPQHFLEGGIFDREISYLSRSSIDVNNHSKRIYVWSTDYDYAIYSFENAEKYSLDNAVFYISSQHADAIMHRMQEEGFSVGYASIAYPGTDGFVVEQVILMCFFILSVLFYAFSQGKEIVVKKMSGYSFTHYMADIFQRDGIIFLGILGIFFIISGIMISFNSHIFTAILFFKHIFLPTIIIMTIIICCTLLGYAIIFFYSKHEQYKGKTPNIHLMVLSYFSKVMVVILILLLLPDMISHTQDLIHLHQTQKETAEKVEGIASIHINVSRVGSDYHFANYEEYDKNADEFYVRIDEVLRPVIIDADEYGYSSLLAEERSHLHLIINNHYLEINPVYTQEEQLIDPSFIEEGTLTVLIPPGSDDIEQRIELLTTQYQIDRNDISIITYAEDQLFYTYNPYVRDDDGRLLIDRPWVVMFDLSLHSHELHSMISRQALLFTDVEDDFYDEVLLPYLEEAKLSDICLEATYISTRFAEVVSWTQEQLMISILALSFLFIVLVSASVYLSAVYCAAFEKEIIIKKIAGFSFIYLHIKMMVIMWLLYLVCFLLIFFTAITLPLVLLFCVFDFFVLIFIIRAYEKKSLATVIKGG